MGLDVSVGLLIDLAQEDPEALKTYRGYFAALNRVLRAEGLPEHVEPQSGEGIPWGRRVGGYSALHHLRRLAAHLWSGMPLPPPVEEKAAQDPVLQGIYTSGKPTARGLLGRLFGTQPRGPSFEHLINHSDAEGFYVPADFPHVVYCDDQKVPGGMIGSSARLQAELRTLAAAIGLPLDLDPDSDEVLEASEDPPPDAPGWKRYGYESHVLLTLWTACELSLRNRAAVIFH